MGGTESSQTESSNPEPRQCPSKPDKVVAGQGAAVKEVNSFQKRLPSLNRFGCAAENFVPSAGDGRISGLSLDPVRIEDQR